MRLKSVLIYKRLQSWELIVPLVKSANAAVLLFSRTEYWRGRWASLRLFSYIPLRLAYLTSSSWHWRTMGAEKATDKVHFIPKWNPKLHSYVRCVLCYPWQTKAHSQAAFIFLWQLSSEATCVPVTPNLVNNKWKAKCLIQQVPERY